MNNGLSAKIFRSAPFLVTLILAIAAFSVRAQDNTSRIEFDVLNREQRGLGNVLTDGETDLSSAQTRLLNNSLRLSAQDAARAAIKVAHLRAMAQLHPERCARTTGHFLATAGLALNELTNNFFGNLKPRIVRLEDNLDTYVIQLQRLDPNLAAQLKQIIEAANAAAYQAVLNQQNSMKPIDFDASKILPSVPQNQIAPQGSSGSSGTSGTSGTSGPGSSGNSGSSGTSSSGTSSSGTSSSGSGGQIINSSTIPSGQVYDRNGNLISTASLHAGNPPYRVEARTTDKGILTREDKYTGHFERSANGQNVWAESGPKSVDWQFDIEPSEKGFTLVDRSGGAADEDKGFNVEKWTVVDPSGKSSEFPGTVQVNYPMTASGTYKVTAFVATKLETRFSITISPMNN